MCGQTTTMSHPPITSETKNIARSTDLLFLNSFINTSDAETKETTIQEDEVCLRPRPVTHDSMRLVEQVRTITEQRIYLDEAKELFSLLTSKWILALLEVHDEVAAHIQNSLEEVQYIDGVSSSDEEDSEEVEEGGEEEKEEKSDSSEEIVDTFRVIGLRRKLGESLGLTVSVDESGKVIVARIIMNSFIERQGLLRPGDIILEANNKKIQNPEQLQEAIESSREFITLKIKPTLTLSQSLPTVAREKCTRPGKYHVRALYSYDPAKDSLLPCAEIGLPFHYGDILEVVNASDPSWWQARQENGDTIGLIPSQDLEERRKCFVEKKDRGPTKISCCGSGKKEKKRFGYHFRKNAEMDTADLQLYEAVEKMPPFTRKTLVLVGPQAPPGAGAKSILHKIVNHDNNLFGTVKAVTSRPKGEHEGDGDNCWFVSSEEIEAGQERDEFLEIAEHEGYLLGTTFQSIRSVIAQGKLCVIDCKPETIKLLHHNPEFLPYVIFLAAPTLQKMKTMSAPPTANGHSATHSSDDDLRKSIEESYRLREEYQKYFDLEIVHEDFEKTFRTILTNLEKIAAESQWVPLNWVYS